ncbi:hypothetical protein JAAARDRAFT_199285 [Jaapia argillacea MUCL 33604]|uniref:AB hydrolase-1 domain-containing protein n=1 Tax=Jaapia argillacea MUCL 33604 TaxID=933084 RepID=A0A067P8Y5_9AGAM|nr:hypothetical protein JAAARDRAFT_199285 [Jaapia argillacea MUCL 33604]
MLFIFQRKVIYMGYAPPGARNEQLGRDTPVPKRLHCEEIQVRSEKNVIVHGLLVRQKGAETQLPSAVIVYFQGILPTPPFRFFKFAILNQFYAFEGNAGNPLHRLPVFASLICPSNQLSTSSPPSSTAVIAVAPRSYWKSTNRMPTQQSLIRDYTAVLSHTHKLFPTSPIIIYGHSLGAAIATCLLSSTTLTPGHHSLDDDGWKQNLKGVVLENPFTSVPDMVKALYPQKWLPYHYMGRFVWDKWDAVGSLRQDYTAATPKYPAGGGNGEKEAGYRGTVMESIIRDRRVLVLVSEKDEVVPPEMGHQLSAAMATRYFGSLGREGGHGEVGCRTVIIKDALHENAWTQRQWIDELTGFVERMRLQ